MKSLIQRYLSLFLLGASFFIFQNEAKATHVAGGYIQMECTGTPGQYKIELILYRDCSASTTSGLSSPTVRLTNSCGLSSVNVTLSRLSGYPIEVSQICDEELDNTKCKNRFNPNPGYQEYIFTATVNLGECDSWTASYNLAARNTITNIDGASSTDFAISSQFNTASGSCNTTPTVTAQPEPFVCINQPVSYNLGAHEPDGNTITYSLIPAVDEDGDELDYEDGYSPTSPIPGATIDPNSGTVSFTPTSLGNFLFVVRMEERNSDGVLVSVTHYEYQTFVLNCSNQLPQPPSSIPGGGVSNISGSIVQNGPSSLTLCQGYQGCFDVVFTDPDLNDVLTVESNIAAVMPGATVTTTGTNPLTVSVCWTPVVTSGVVSLSFLVEDGACPIVGQNNYAATINVVNPGVPNVVTTTEVCGGTDEGTATITMTGGVAPFTYNISGPTSASNTTGVFTGLAPGNYTYTVETGGGCDIPGTFTIVAGPPLPITSSGTNLTCNASNDGTATVDPTGGTAPFVYVWSQGGTPIGQTTQTASNLSAGTYDVVVTDAIGCYDNATVVITEPNVLTGALTPVDAACKDEASGAINVVSVAGGTAPYEYILNNNDTLRTGSTFNGLNAGSYQVEIRDANGCSLILNTTVDEPGGLDYTLSSVVGATCGSSTGSFRVNASGGIGPYSYTDGTTTNSNGRFEDLLSGTHYITVTDGNGCQETWEVEVAAIPEPVAYIETSQNLSCFGGNNGEVLIGVDFAASPITYSLNGGTAQSSNQFTGLPAGNHVVTVVDGNGCDEDIAFTITQPAVLTYTSTPISTSCAGNCDGEIEIVAAGGTAPYQYSSNGGLTWTSSDVLTGLCAGLTNIVVRDDMGCQSNSTVTVVEPAPLTATYVNTDPICRDDSNGSIEVNTSGGTTPYEYSIDGGTPQAGNSFIGLTAGTYAVKVEDANGCDVIANRVLNNPPGIDLAAVSTTSSNCGHMNGGIEVIASGVNPPFLYSLGGSPNQVSGVFTNLYAGAYKVIVTDDLGCRDSTFFGINDVEMDGTLLYTTDVTCYGGSDGAVEVINGAGAAPITFELNNSGSVVLGTENPVGSGTFERQFTGIEAGNHIVTIYDAGSCIYTVPFEILQPDEIDFTMNTSDALCYGGSSGIMEVVGLTGGTSATGDYLLTIDGGMTTVSSTTFSGLAAGDYTVMVLDDEYCWVQKPFTVGEAPIIEFETNLVDLTCNNNNSGIIQVVSKGGTGAHEYSIDNGVSFQSSMNFMGLAAGTYDLVVQDAEGCEIPGTATLIEPAQLTATYTPLATECFEACDGEIEINAAGGTTPYEYSIDNGVTISTNNTITGICASTFDVLVRDDNGCFITSSQTVTEPTQVTFTSVEIPSTCSDPNGEIEITASGGTPTYTYSIDNGVTFVTTPDFSGLAEGTYNLRVLDANNCPAVGTQAVTDQPSPVITMVTTTRPLCNGDSNGQITVTATGGTGTLMYAVNGGTPQSSPILTGLPAGIHTVSVTDDNGCVDIDATVELTEPDPLTFASTPTPLTCYQNSTGRIQVVPNGGTPAYQYSFDNGATFGSSPMYNFIAAGSYNIVVRDANNCTVAGTETVVEPTQLVFDNIVTTDALCKDACDGEIELTVSGGTAPYTYNWLQSVAGSNDAQATGLCDGTYGFIVTDDNGCLINDEAVINEPDSVLITNIIKTNVTCHGDCDGEVELTSPTAVEYSIDGGVTYQASNVFSNLCAGDYQVVARDVNGCIVPRTANIWQADPLSLTLTDDTTVCHAYNYQLVGEPRGGIQPYVYQWSNGGSTTHTLDIIATETETYTLDLFDVNGCTIPTESVTVTVIPLVDITITQDTTICPGGGATIVAEGVDGLPNYSYVWDNGETNGSIVVSPSQITDYTVTVTDECGDQATATVTVDLHPLPVVSFEGDDLTGCVPHTVNFTNTTNASDVGGNCVWTINGKKITGCTDLEYTFNSEFCYDVGLQVESPFGCVSDTTYTDYICVDDYPIANFSYTPQFPTSLNNVVEFTNTTVGAVAYNWTFEGEGSTNEANPTIRFGKVKGVTELTVCLEATSQYGCVHEVCQDIEFKEEFAVYVPNSFTPGGDDQYNPIFLPIFPPDSEIYEYHLIIFNRWGEIIFESFDHNIGWNGTYSAESTDIVKDGTYIWKIELTEGPERKRKEFTGHVNLIK